ncbi:hypothetical protein G6O69_17040 [Pseudenhygromyxa sp. WMMC2535]|uniref:hypothetical protein n=1 Tax=Pseudenhygromyxa sp. WMMC2535 TaxID=2712867 RepID=UPI0015570711|nr:hypothetical protein [Pseudenhygromyxa sp. WMMC2535]NVB39551.1 hypothetical protein [Pseudenhygromyxa sp. WMMC2535]
MKLAPVSQKLKLFIRPAAGLFAVTMVLGGCVEGEDDFVDQDLEADFAATSPDTVEANVPNATPVSETCGDGVLDAGEDCEPSLGVGSTICADVDSQFDDGTLACSSSCTFDVSDCLVPGEGDACTYSSHCGQYAPVCVNGACSVGDEGDACNYDSHCGENSPVCVDSVCWDGGLGDSCVNDNDCIGAPYCVDSTCHMGDAGDPCIYDSDCNSGAPFCADGTCSAGEIGDACVYDNDCSEDAPFCAIDQCSEGAVGDTCAVSDDCSEAAPFCGGGACSEGLDGDACDSWDGDCSESAPFCVNSMCSDGGADDACVNDGDCSSNAPYCSNLDNICTTGEPGESCGITEDCISLHCNYTAGVCN